MNSTLHTYERNSKNIDLKLGRTKLPIQSCSVKLAPRYIIPTFAGVNYMQCKPKVGKTFQKHKNTSFAGNKNNLMYATG